MPSLQQLRYLVAIADTLHFRRAAQTVNVTQPTLSMQLREMELRLGVQLVERSRARVLLTPVGAEIAARARRILTEVESIRDIANAARAPLGGTIRLGVVQSLGPYLLPQVIPDLHDSLPDLRLYVREGLPDALIDRLEEGALDLLLYPLPFERAGLVTRPIFREPLLAVVPREHRLAGRPCVRRQDLEGETILALEAGHRLNEQVHAIARECGARLSTDFEGTSLDTLRQMVAMGTGISLLPALYVRSEVAREEIVVARAFDRDAPSRDIGMIWRSSSGREPEFRDLAEIVAGSLMGRVPDVTVFD